MYSAKLYARMYKRTNKRLVGTPNYGVGVCVLSGENERNSTKRANKNQRRKRRNCTRTHTRTHAHTKKRNLWGRHITLYIVQLLAKYVDLLHRVRDASGEISAICLMFGPSQLAPRSEERRAS